MELTIRCDVSRLEISDRSFSYITRCDLVGCKEASRPGASKGIQLVVERACQSFLEHERPAIDAEEPRRCPVIAHIEREIATHHSLRRPRQRRQPAARAIRDLPRSERPRRDLAQDLGDDVERAHFDPFNAS